ncbi:hypothetical protein [Paraglaciecola psychrophila]|uniref:hypothetical protein n=1 Tax=Paraglaciecola psychrophila TaxID=326544 RepID=UPI0009DA6814|nr:hypothetical protein [Paraglaciecola psychrophila]
MRDKRLLKLIKHYLRAGIINNQLYVESREGVTQGGPLSPSLANIMLDPLDNEPEKTMPSVCPISGRLYHFGEVATCG